MGRLTRGMGFLLISLLFLACGPTGPEKRPSPEAVEVPCGGFTMDGMYEVGREITTRTYVVEGGEILGVGVEDVVEDVTSFLVTRTGCASGALGIALHSSDAALVVDIEYDLPATLEYLLYTHTTIRGACDLGGCSFATQFETYNKGELVAYLERDWEIIILRKVPR